MRAQGQDIIFFSLVLAKGSTLDRVIVSGKNTRLIDHAGVVQVNLYEQDLGELCGRSVIRLGHPYLDCVFLQSGGFGAKSDYTMDILFFSIGLMNGSFFEWSFLLRLYIFVSEYGVLAPDRW